MSDVPLSRREFAAMAAALGFSMTAGTASAADEKPQEAAADLADSQESPDEGTQAVAEPTESELLLQILRLRYPGDRLDEEVLAHIQDEIDSDLRRSKSLDRFPLANSDEPACSFAAYRRE